MDITEEEKLRIREKVEKLKASRFKQQTLPAWRPIPSFGSTMITFTVFGVIFLGLGILLYIMSDQVTEIPAAPTYDDKCPKDSLGGICNMTMTIDKDIPGPVYVYYQLDNFYQNHRRYVKSRSFNQLNGKWISTDKELSDCDPIKKNSDLGPNITKSINGTLLAPNDPAVPCGLVAKSFFNDTYRIFPEGGTDKDEIKINQKDISWQSDRDYKFHNVKNHPQGLNYTQFQWVDMEDGKL